MASGKYPHLQRIVTKWRRGRERHKRLQAGPTPQSRPAEQIEAKPGTHESTT